MNGILTKKRMPWLQFERKEIPYMKKITQFDSDRILHEIKVYLSGRGK